MCFMLNNSDKLEIFFFCFYIILNVILGFGSYMYMSKEKLFRTTYDESHEEKIFRQSMFGAVAIVSH